MKKSIFNAVCKTRYLALLVVLIFTCGNAWGKEGDELAVCQGTGSGYGTRRTLTDSHSVGWVLASGQSGYLGANSTTNHNKVKPTAADLPVVKAQNASATTTTTGYYFYYTSTAISNVGSIVFSYTANSGNSLATAYIVSSSTAASSGSATWSKPTLASGTGLSAQGVSLGTSGTFTFQLSATETSAKYYGIIIVTDTYKRMTAGTITIKEGATGGSSTPTITKSSDFSTFGYSSGSPVAQSFTVSGTNLTANLVVKAPTNYEVCKTENGTYGSSVSFTPSTGSVSDETVYIRLVSGLSAGNYNYTSTSAIRLTSTGATEVDIAVNGMVPYTINWETNGSNHTTTYVDYGGTLTLPNTSPSTSCGGRVFVGWYEGSYSHATDAPTFAKTGDAVTGSTTHTFNAVYAMCDDDSPTSITSFATGDYYLIDYYSSGSKYYAMQGSTSSGITAVDVTSYVSVDGTTITVNPASFTSDMVYTISGNSSAAYIKQGTTDVGNSTGTSFGSSSWTVTENSDRFEFSGNSRCILYQSSSNIWKNYATSNMGNSGYSSGYLYLVPVPTYSDFTTTCAACAADPDMTSAAASLKGAFSLTSVGVTATGWAAGTNCSWVDYGFVWSESESTPTLVEATGNAATNCTKVQKGTSGTATTWDDNLLKSSFEVDHTYKYRAYGKNGKEGATYKYSSVQTFTPRQVSFSMHDHGDAPSNQIVADGTKASDPGDPSASGWTFLGWWDNSSYTGSAWDFSSNTVSGSSVTLHAKWTEKPKYTITLNAGNGTISDANWTNTSGSTYTRTQSNGDEAITLPTPSCNCSGWVFQGWSTTSKDNAASFTPDKEDGASFTPASDVTYYAVYRANATGGTTYNKITSTGDLTTGDYLFVSSTSYAMKNVVTNSRMDEVNGFTSSNSSQTTDNTNLVWTIVKINSQVVIKNGANYIGIDAGNNICLTTTPHFFTYTYVAGSNRWEFTSATKTSYQLVYNSYFKIGASQTTAIYLYKQGAGLTGNYYTNPSCSEITVTGAVSPAGSGTVTLTAGSGKTGDKVYAMYTPDEDYNFDHWSISGNGSTLGSTSEVVTEITIGTANTTVTANFVAKDWKTVTWKANGVALTGEDLGSASVKVENGFDITALPPSPDPCDGTSTTFIGWVEESDIWSGPTDDVSGVTIYEDVSDFPTVTDDVTYHAVWARQNGSAAPATYAGTGVFTKITTLDELEVGAHYVLYGIEDANPTTVCGAMNNSFINEASGKNVFGVSSVTISDNKITNPATTIVWKLGGTTDAYTLYSQNSSKYVEITANDTRGYTNPSSATTSFTITVSEGNFKIITNYASANSRMINIYSASAFRAYSYLSEGYTLNLYKYGSNYTYDKYLVKCCNTPTLAFAASPYAVLREDLGGASTTTWAEVDVTFTSNSSGEIRATKYSNATVTNGTAYVLAASKWQVYETTGGTLCGASHAYFEVLTQPSGATPGTGKFHVKTTSGQTGQGTYRIAITQAATDESHGNFCETTVYGFVDVTLRDKFVDNVNGNGTINRNGHGAQLATPTLSEFDTQEEDACHSEGRKLKGWIKETDLKAQYETGNSTRVQTVDGLCETCADGTDQTSLIVAPGANVTMSGATWYAVWAYEK